MKIVGIEFALTQKQLSEMNAEQIEEAIKVEVLTNIVNAITPMLDDNAFIEMAPSEDGKSFNIKTSVVLGSTTQFLEAIQSVTKTLNTALSDLDVDEDEISDIISDVTKPLVDLMA